VNMDKVDPATRSRMMASVRSKNTAPELAVRRLAHRLGYRFRLHRRGLPGTPDMVFPKYRVAIQVHGCFWHGHEDCRHAARPRSNTEFWNEKIERNRVRDARDVAALAAAGWTVLIVWGCEVKDEAELTVRLRTALSLPGHLHGSDARS